ARLNWTWIGAQLDAEGYAILPGLLDGAQAGSIAALICPASAGQHMSLASPGPGRGDIFYLPCALPEPLSAWRNSFYPPLAPISNRWNTALGIEERFPATFDAFHMQNKKAGQTTSLSSLS